MLIVITRDERIIEWVKNHESNADAWGKTEFLDTKKNRQQATNQLRRLVRQVKQGEALCLIGHGNDEEVGDEGTNRQDWGWKAEQLAEVLAADLCQGYKGPILIESCATKIESFVANLASQLKKERVLGVFLYGYSRPIDIKHTLPKPEWLGKSVEVHGLRV